MRKNKKSGFTLVELVVVIVILGILATIAVPRVFESIEDARKKADLATAQAISTAIDVSLAKHKGKLNYNLGPDVRKMVGMAKHEMVYTSKNIVAANQKPVNPIDPLDTKYHYKWAILWVPNKDVIYIFKAGDVDPLITMQVPNITY